MTTERALSAADLVFAWLVLEVGKGKNADFPKIREQLVALYQCGFDDGIENEHDADKGLGGT